MRRYSKLSEMNKISDSDIKDQIEHTPVDIDTLLPCKNPDIILVNDVPQVVQSGRQRQIFHPL